MVTLKMVTVFAPLRSSRGVLDPSGARHDSFSVSVNPTRSVPVLSPRVGALTLFQEGRPSGTTPPGWGVRGKDDQGQGGVGGGEEGRGV